MKDMILEIKPVICINANISIFKFILDNFVTNNASLYTMKISRSTHAS